MNKNDLEGIAGVEKEDVGSPKITTLYGPDKIKVDQQNVNLGYLIEMLEDESFISNS